MIVQLRQAEVVPVAPLCTFIITSVTSPVRVMTDCGRAWTVEAERGEETLSLPSTSKVLPEIEPELENMVTPPVRIIKLAPE